MFHLVSSISQGSIIGDILINIYINDLVSNFHSSRLVFAYELFFVVNVIFLTSERKQIIC